MNKEVDLKLIAPYAILAILIALLVYFNLNTRQTSEDLLAQNAATLQSISEQKAIFTQIQDQRNQDMANAQGERASFAKVQKLLSENNLNNYVRQIEPQSTEQDLIIEERITLSLQDLDLALLTKLLYAIELNSNGLIIENLNLSKNPRNFLDVELSISSQISK